MFEATNQSSIFSSQNSISMVYTMNCPIMFPILSYIFPIMFPSFSHQVPTKNIVFRCLAPIFLLVLSREWEWSINSISTSIITILIIIPFPHSLLSTSKFFMFFPSPLTAELQALARNTLCPTFACRAWCETSRAAAQRRWRAKEATQGARPNPSLVQPVNMTKSYSNK